MLVAADWLRAAATAKLLQETDLRVKSVDIVACMHENKDVLVVIPQFHPQAANAANYEEPTNVHTAQSPQEHTPE